MTLIERRSNGRDIGNKLLFFLIGGSIGAAVALLFAPKSGDELRSDIADATRRGYDTALGKAKELKDRSAEVVGNVRDRANELYLTAADKASTASEIASNVLSDAKKRFAEGKASLASGTTKDEEAITSGESQTIM